MITRADLRSSILNVAQSVLQTPVLSGPSICHPESRSIACPVSCWVKESSGIIEFSSWRLLLGFD